MTVLIVVLLAVLTTVAGMAAGWIPPPPIPVKWRIVLLAGTVAAICWLMVITTDSDSGAQASGPKDSPAPSPTAPTRTEVPKAPPVSERIHLSITPTRSSIQYGHPLQLRLSGLTPGDYTDLEITFPLDGQHGGCPTLWDGPCKVDASMGGEIAADGTWSTEFDPQQQETAAGMYLVVARDNATNELTSGSFYLQP